MRKASLVQVRQGKDGRMIEISEDVMDVCRRIREVDPALGVDWNEENSMFRIYELGPDGRKRTVFWTPELTPDIPNHLQLIGKEDYVKAVELQDRKAERDADHRHHENVGPVAEKLAHAVRKDKGYKGRAFIPKEI